jgi:hypothetical protein
MFVNRVRQQTAAGTAFLALAAVVGAFALSVAPASAAGAPAPAWHVVTAAIPTVLQPGLGRRGDYEVTVENVGAVASEGEITVKDNLPAGLTSLYIGEATEPSESSECPTRSAGELVCVFHAPVVPSGFVVMHVEFEVTGNISSLPTNAVTVSGGNAAPVTNEVSTHVGAEHETGPGGVAQFGFEATGPAGEPFTQAGGHPHFLTTTLILNSMFDEKVEESRKPVQPAKDLVFYLPMGLLGDPAVAEPCPQGLVEFRGFASGCPAASRVGTILAMIFNNVYANTSDSTSEHGIYSVTPEKGYAAEFAFATNGVEINLYANVVRHDGAYMLRVSTPGVPDGASLIGLVATFFGDITETYQAGHSDYTYDRGAFLTLPSDCEEGAGAREASVELNTWLDPDAIFSKDASAFPALEGCDSLSFNALLSGAPDTSVAGDTTQADEPSGYKLDLQVPQAPNGGTGLGTPPYQGVDFTFPEGTSLSPGAANGLTACPASGPEGIDFPNGQGTPGNSGTETGEGEEDGPDGLPLPVAGHCPSSSQVGTARASVPELHEELTGHLFLAEPECGNAAHPNPCTPQDAADGSLYRLYLELEAPNDGIVIKLPGKALVNPVTGRVESVFEGTPRFPVRNLVIETSGGPRASLANPQSCGTATTTGLITPWSAPYTPPVRPSGSFEVTGCAGVFAPSFTAGTSNTGAGSYSPFTLTLKREDREQDVSAISSTLPAGLLAAVKNVAQCPEPQASQGACPASSQVGTTSVGVGSGTDPLYQEGQVYFTGPYGGAPFGLSVVVPAVAGPFNLGDVIVRVALHINPSTAQVTAISSPIPQMIDGVPLRIRAINVTLNNPAFTFNATNCSALSITGAAASTQGATAGLSSPYQAGGCANLPFKPVLSAGTVADASKAHGASLDVKVTSKGGPQSGGGEANIKAVKVDLPKQLPTPLKTLQKACLAATFEANPANCPKESDVGTATASTPILANPLSGPAYLVSHGGEAFPDLEIVLQGEGVELVLDGNTLIKNGITSSTFKTVPDAPISSFELKLPTGKFPILATNLPESAKYDLCGQILDMPTEITGQNGAVVKQTTKIGVAGCTKAKKATKKKKKAKKASKSTRRSK